MRRRTVIRTGLFFGSVCLSIWQLPQLLERMDGILGRNGVGLPTAVRAAELPTAADVERADPGQIIVYSPDGKAMTRKELEELRRRAAANAPINAVAEEIAKKAEQSAPSDPNHVQIGAPNPDVEEILRILREKQAKDED